jgi:hypothetical protein
MSQETYAPTTRHQSNKGRGWLFGCLIVLIIGMIAVIVLASTVYVGLRNLRDSVTDTAPQELPITELSAETLEAAQAKVAVFKEAVTNDQPTVPLVLSQDDLNALVQGDSDYKYMKDKIHFSLEGDEIGGAISIPLEALGVSFLEGRYINGAATFSVFLRDGLLHVYIRSLELKGEPAPEAFLSGIRTENLAKDPQRDDPEFREVLERLESVEIKDGQLIVTPKKTE